MPIPQKKILVVDDEPAVCAAIKMMLEFDGHEVLTAHSAKEALAVFDAGKFDLVTTDCHMPGMPGDELATAIKARAPGMPVIMISAHAETLRASGHSMEGLDFVIGKPFSFKDLREAIAKVSPPAARKKPA